MFDPTDVFFSRRLFLARGAQLLSVAATIPTFLERSARCLAADFAANPQGAGRPDQVLVVLQLAGGNDGLNTVVPLRDDDYRKARPRLAIPADKALRLTDDLGLHPSATGLARLYEQGRLAIVQAVGYPNPNRSHFRSTDIWASAEPDKLEVSGWLGRYFDACCAGADPGPAKAGAKPAAKADAAPADPQAAIALVNDPPMALQGRKYLPLAFRSPDNLTYRGFGRDMRSQGAFEKLNDLDSPDAQDMSPDDPDHKMTMSGGAGGVKIPYGTKGSLEGSPDAPTEFVQRSALNARVYAEQIQKTARSVQNKATYPTTGLGRDLKLVAQMIAANMPTRVYYVTLGGFDTHAGQVGRHDRLMKELGDAVLAFNEDLAAFELQDRVTLMTFSEFGRRVAENASGGTDHGEAAPLFVMGGKVKPGIYGQSPVLAPARLNRGDVPFTTDFRRVYATVLKQWLKADDAKILGRRFEPLPLLKA